MANNPNSKEKIAARKAARKASGMSAQKFYVTTRLAEAAKSGKKLDRATLRKKFQSGDVARKGFAAPKKKTGTTSTVGTKVGLKPEIRTNNTFGRRAYGGVPQKAPKTNLSSKGYFYQSADTRETVPKAYAKSARKRQGRYGS